MAMKIWVYAEQAGKALASIAPELLGESRRLAAASGKEFEVAAVLIGDGVSHLAAELFAWGADTVYTADDPRLAVYNNETYSRVFKHLIQKHNPEIVLIGATAIGSELAPTVAAQVGTGLAAHCVELKLTPEGELICVVPSFGGKVMGEILCPAHRPQMATIKPGVMEKGEKHKGRYGKEDRVDVDEALKGYEPRIAPLSVHHSPPEGKPLEAAEVVIAGGWGIGSKEDWKLLEELAEALGGAVGCTRPAVDEGWAPGEHVMIGTSGKTIKPKVYIGVGISGATHHICGMKDSGTIISINKDPNAAIFGVSDVKVVSDFKKILPLLIKRIKE